MALDWSVDDLTHRSTLLCVAFFSLCAWYNASMQVTSDILGAGMKGTLPDLGFTVLPFIPFDFIPDMFVFVHVVGTAIWIAIYEDNFPVILRRCFVVQGVIFFFRGCSIVLTILPNPDVTCVMKHSAPIPVAGLLVLLGWNSTCGDVCFSGHSATMVHACLVWQHYVKSERLRRFALMGTTTGVILVVCTHFHYSLDVTLATLAAYTCFHKYKDLVTSEAVLDHTLPPSSSLTWWLRRLENNERDAAEYQHQHHHHHPESPLGPTHTTHAAFNVGGGGGSGLHQRKQRRSTDESGAFGYSEMA